MKLLNKQQLLAVEVLNHLNELKVTRVSDLAKKLDTTEDFLQQIVRKLRINNYIVSTRGPGGGIKLKADIDLDSLPLYPVVKLFEASPDYSNGNEIEHKLDEFLNQVSVRDAV